MPGGCSATSRPCAAIARLALGILGRVSDVDAARDHRDRAAVERAVMRGGVDPAGEARNHHRARRADVVRQHPREAARRRRGVARADQRDRGLFEQGEMAFDDQRRRRAFELGEQRRIEALAEKQVARAGLRDGVDLALDRGAGGEPGRPAPAARGEIGDGVDRGGGRAEAGEQLEIGDRADIVGTDQAQPGDLVFRRARSAVSHGGGQSSPSASATAALRPTRGSAPASSRSTLARCFHKTSRPKPR